MPAHPVRSARGFTLVELLVVVGIIAILIGLLLPVISSARATGWRISCASQQREIMAAALQRANGNGGYLPLAGKLVLHPDTSGLGSLPHALNDSARRRYAYLPPSFGNPTFEYPGSALFALRDYLETPPDTSLWICPAAEVGDTIRARPSVTMIIGGTEYVQLNDPRNSYAFNGGVSGFHYADAYAPRRQRGSLARVQDASRVMWLCDALNSGAWVELSVFSPALDQSGPVTLADALDGLGKVDLTAEFDTHRHRGSMNIAFIDGRVESKRISPEGLADVFLTME